MPYEITEPLGRRLAYAGKNMLTMLNCTLRDMDIERCFYPLLLINNGGGQLTQQDLCVLLKTDKVTVLRVVDYLSDNGYVTRQIHEKDKRKHLLVATHKAAIKIQTIVQSLEYVERAALVGLSEGEISEFRRILSIIEANTVEFTCKQGVLSNDFFLREIVDSEK